MAGWTGASLMPQMVGDKLKEYKRRISVGGDNVTRRALTSSPSTTRGSVIAPPVVASPTATNNLPAFLQGGSGGNEDILNLISEMLGLTQGNQANPDLVEAQTALAREQAVQARLQNNEVQKQMESQNALGYLQRQQKDLQYSPFQATEGLRQMYQDREKVLRKEGELNWLNMPWSSFSTGRQPLRNRGWTGPAMPGTWGL